LLISLIGLISHLLVLRHLIRDQVERNTAGGGHFQLPTKAILPLGIIAFCGMLGEGAMADWSAIFMNTVVGKNETFSALTFGTFAAAMTIGRLFGDHFTGRYGARQVLMIDSSLAIAGLGLLLAFPLAWTTFLGFFLIGLGLSTVVPIVYSKAGNTPGVGPSAGIAMATTIGYTGFFVGPPVIGFLSDLYGLRIALTMILLLFATMGLLVRRI
jgi:MFS family permease